MLNATHTAGDVIRGPGVAFRVRRVLGVGGMGEVYEVEDNSLGITSVVKMLRPNIATDHPSIVRRFVNEAKVLAKVVHRNSVRVTQLARTESGTPFYVMENIQGISLRQLIAKRAPFAPDVATRLVIHVLYGLDAAHKRGVVHRDIKPDNILVCREGSELVAKIIDFGVMRLLDDTSEEGFCGTPAYAAPEQILMRAPTPKMDVFSAGMVIYEMLAGKRPYASFGIGEQAAAARATAPAPLVSDDNPEVSGELAMALATMLALDPKERPSAFEAAALLQRVPDLRDLGPAATGVAITQEDLVKAPHSGGNPITLADMSNHTEPDGPPEEVVEAIRRNRFPTHSGQTQPPSAPKIRAADKTEPDGAPVMVSPKATSSAATKESPELRERALRQAETRERPVDAPPPEAAKNRVDTIDAPPSSSPAVRYVDADPGEPPPPVRPNAGPMTLRSAQKSERPKPERAPAPILTPSASPAPARPFPRLEHTTPMAPPAARPASAPVSRRRTKRSATPKILYAVAALFVLATAALGVVAIWKFGVFGAKEKGR